MFTNNYIEMVSKAEEIQGLWKINEGNWFVYNGTNGKNEKLNSFCSTPANEIKPYMREYYSWLPTLEDLFEMVKPIFSRTALELNYVVVGNIIEVLIGKCDSEGCGLDIEFTATSLETGLLRAIMAYQYNKSWNPDTKQWEAIK